MRLDHTLYVLAVVFFIITLTSFTLLSGTSRLLWVIASAALGAISAGLGFIHGQNSKQTHPQTTTSTSTPIPTPAPAVVEETAQPEPAQTTQTTTPAPPIEAPAEATAVTEPAAVEETPQIPATPQAEEAPLTQLSLTDVNGIGEKRALQLNAIGITTVGELAEASSTQVAKSLKVSPKIVAKWIADAKTLNKK
jgi:predicted flap endonuclease-1-like 5' DNA nuclease